MPADKQFIERLARIEKGRQWAPDGVVHQPKAHGEAAKRQQARGRKLRLFLAMACGVPAWVIYAEPQVPDPILGFFTAPTTEAAMASLGQMPFLSGISLSAPSVPDPAEAPAAER
jgi:hypothetical protein